MKPYRLLMFFAGTLAMAQTVPFTAEGLPDDLVARLQVRDRFLAELPASPLGFAPQSVFDTLKRWMPGSTVRVAFNGGDNTLRQEIADAASAWVAHGNIKLDFGYDPRNGSYRNWTVSDRQYVAEVRISFNQAGYWSLVGRDAVDPNIAGPGVASMNFGGFTFARPSDWSAVVAHEFGHAFGLQHEHQSPIGGCDLQFRWNDDANYEPTKDERGQYIADSQGRRPGLYTVLGGPPNNWSSQKVDFNLRGLPNSRAFDVGPFDKKSIMMYSFPAWMFISPDSTCHTTQNLALSDQDIAGFGRNYPAAPADVTSVLNETKDLLKTVLSSPLSDQSKTAFRALSDTIH